MTRRVKRLREVRSADIFGYEPRYAFPGYRTLFGVLSSCVLVFAVSLRVYITLEEVVQGKMVTTEQRFMFPTGMRDSFTLPRVGLVFKKTGWKPFYDPTYFRFRFQQGKAGRSSNSTYTELDELACSFVDTFGRIIEDDARCPHIPGQVLGNFFDDEFRYLRISIMRCHNGTTADGRPAAGPCRRPDEIDELIWTGTITLLIAQTDMDSASDEPFQRLVIHKKMFTENVHPTYDVSFAMRQVDIEPIFYFDQYQPDASRQFVVFDEITTSYTDFRPQRIGKFNLVDPSYVPQYAAFFLLLGAEQIHQQRFKQSAFQLMETWGATICFFYVVCRQLAWRWNRFHFKRQVKGVDLRDLNREQFSHFGRLVDRSFLVPKELQEMWT